MTVTGTLTQGDMSYALTLTLSDKSRAKISIDSPDTIRGYSFTVDNEGIWVYYDDMQIDLHAVGSHIPILWVVDMLSLSEEDYRYSRKEEDATVSFYEYEDTQTVLYTRKNEDFPFRIEHTRKQGSVRFDIDTFILQ